MPKPAGFHRSMLITVSALALSVAVVFRLQGIHFASVGYFTDMAAPIAGLAIAAGYCHWAKLAKLADACLLIAWAFALFLLLPLPGYAAAHAGFPLADQTLVTLDRAMFIDVGAMVRWSRAHPWAESLSWRVYGSMPVLLMSAVLIPALTGRTDAVKRLLAAVSIAVILGAFVFMLVPAAGPWEGYSYTPYPNQPLASAELRMVRAGGGPERLPSVSLSEDKSTGAASPVVLIDPAASCGLIAFPSFHVCLAILAASSFAGFRGLRIPAAVLAALIAVSTMTTGWHYGADVAGGVLVATLSLLAADRLLSPRMIRSTREVPVGLPA